MLRGLASGHDQDPSYDQFLSTATELEARAHALATTDPAAPRDPKRDTALHAPVDLVI